MMASKGMLRASSFDEEGFWDVDCGAVRSVIEVEERRSVAEARTPPTAEDVLWSWEDEYILCSLSHVPATLRLPLQLFGNEWALGDVKGVPLYSIRQFVTSRNILHHHVLLLDSCFLQCLFRAFEKRANDLWIPSGVDDADSEVRSCYTYQLELEIVIGLQSRTIESELGEPRLTDVPS